MAAVQSRVAAPVVSGPQAPPPRPRPSRRFTMARTGCSKCSRRGFQSARGTSPTRALSSTRTPAPSSWPSSASRARLPPVAASGDLEPECVIGEGRPPQDGLHPWVTSSWAPWLTLPWLAPRRAPAAVAVGLHPEDSPAPDQHDAPHPLQLPPTYDRGHSAARGSYDFSPLEELRSKLLLVPVLPGLGTASRSVQASLSGKSAVVRTSSGVMRNNSSSTARLARGRSVTPKLIPQREPTVLVEQLLLARTARSPRGLSRRCSPSRRRRTSPGPKSFSPVPLWKDSPTAIRRWNLPPGEDWDRPFARLHNATLTAPGHHGHAQCASAGPCQQAPRGGVGFVLPDLCWHAS